MVVCLEVGRKGAGCRDVYAILWGCVGASPPLRGINVGDASYQVHLWAVGTGCKVYIRWKQGVVISRR